MPTITWPKWVMFIQSWIINLIKWYLGLRVTGFTPGDGWPGTIITITGNGFSEDRDQNQVDIGGEPALVIEAAYDRLVVLAGEQTAGGPITVSVGGKTAGSAQEFHVLPYPPVEDPAQAGAPRFFHGPMEGTPQTNVKNQPVLVLVTYPSDHDPGGATNRAALRNDLIARCNEAGQYWDEVSYGSTTWLLQYSEWLPLPQTRRFYFWEQGDIDDARRALFEKTGRAIVFTGTRIYRGGPGGWVPVEHPNPLSYTYLPGASTGPEKCTALRLNGNILYAGTAAGRVFAFDVSNISAPVTLGSTTLPNSHITAIDLHGSHLLVAAREGGIHWLDVSNPAAMVLDATLAVNTQWAMAAKVAGNRGYVGTGTRLRVLDLSGATPVTITQPNLGAWVTDVDVAGNTCVATTDGDGLHVLEVTAGNVIERSAFRHTLRLRAVHMVGNLVHIAANASGFLIVDVSNLAAPALKGQLATTKPCFNVVVQGNEAMVAQGALALLSVNVANPAAPTKNGTELSSSMDPDVAALQTALQVADDGQDLVKDANALYVHALREWLKTPGRSLNPFQGIIVVVNGPFLRGQSGPADGFTYAGDKIQFNHTKGVLYIAHGASVARIAHEIGHWLGMWDIYEEWYADGTVLEGTAAPWCLSGSGDKALFCAHQIHDLMHFYSTVTGNVNVVEREWSPTEKLNQPYELVAHDAVQDTDPNRVHVLKLKAAEGLHYYVEVRQKPNGRIFDQTVPIPAGEPGVTVVTRVTQGTSISNTFERPIMLFGVLRPGEQVVDAARNLIIRVEEQVQERPLIHRVRVQWNQPIPGDPNGSFDMTITPWDTGTWETVDVWVDSPRNNPAGSIEYEFHEGADKTKPRLNGDRPWVHHNNKIYARIRNTGPQAVSDVYVSCYVTSPPGIGDNGNWATLGTKKIPMLPGLGDTIVDFDWKPAVDKHTCLKIAILPQIGEIETNNNMAQENVAAFDSGAASSHQPVILEAEVRSPFVIWRKVDLIVRGLPLGWHAVVEKSWVWLEGHGSRPVRAVIWTDRDSTGGNEQEIPPLALARVEGWTTFDHRYLPIGGILAAVKAVKRVRPEVKVETDGGIMHLYGCIEPPVADVPITVEVTDGQGNSWLLYGVTDVEGCYRIDSGEQGVEFEPGAYVVQTFVTAGGDAAEAESDPVKVVVH